MNHDYTDTIMQVAWKPCSGHDFTSPQMTGFLWAWCVVLLWQYELEVESGPLYFYFIFPSTLKVELRAVSFGVNFALRF